MTPLAIALAVAVLALLWWAAGHHPPTNHAEQDEATQPGGSFHEGEHHGR